MTSSLNLEPRLLRAFVAVAEELHFTRAATRLYVAQQALSRDIRRLERDTGTTLFLRTTRRVQLTADGARLLPYARDVLAAHDALSAAFARRDRPLTVDVAAPTSTGRTVLEAARDRAPDVEFVARYRGGLAGAAGDILAGRLDVSFGRAAGLPPNVLAHLEHRLVRYERVAVLLPSAHVLAALPDVPLARLSGETLYAGAGNDDTAEWTDYARALFYGRGIRPAPAFPRIEGEDEFRRVVHARGWSVLASEVFTAVPGMVLRPVSDPVPLAPVSLVWRRGLHHPGLTALCAAAGDLGAAGGWLEPPEDAWLPEPDRALHGAEPTENEEAGPEEAPRARRKPGDRGKTRPEGPVPAHWRTGGGPRALHRARPRPRTGE